MAVKLRLVRMGKKKQPTYRVVAADARSPRNGRFIEILGFYDPRSDPSTVRIDNEKAVHWLKEGAQPSERVEKLLKISGAWTEFTGEAPPPSVTRAGSAEPAASEADAEPEADEAEPAAAATEPAAEAAAGGAADEAADEPESDDAVEAAAAEPADAGDEDSDSEGES